MQQIEQDWSPDRFLEVGMKEKLKGCKRACQTVYFNVLPTKGREQGLGDGWHWL